MLINISQKYTEKEQTWPSYIQIDAKKLLKTPQKIVINAYISVRARQIKMYVTQRLL